MAGMVQCLTRNGVLLSNLVPIQQRLFSADFIIAKDMVFIDESHNNMNIQLLGEYVA